ncbi:AlpA family transcriptional regulator [Streptomyces sp. STCH 565 A]|uniref:helix-turn-helix transcriptional regulator n=1 Tax=Streptomyces sp. STCH 565 A TaxID=2950532 RepID=UPI002075C608|nr:helix-turn-helix domain-containing protein [Streptomyces sp. STCH 565 A]MCM8549204.1 helix-turn-helix domain-containing protein [Streptomyces sp. STCH 565 A]
MPSLSPRPAHTNRRGPLATPAEVAEYLGVPVKTLYQWKYRGIGPNVHKVGRHLRYRWAEVDAWLNAQAAYDLAV